MLKRFATKNFRGFVNKIELDLSIPRNYEFSSFAIKDGIIKNGIIYGPNGSGKSNFGLAIFDIVNHLTQKNKMTDYYLNFAYAGHANLPVEFEYTFEFGGKEVYYQYTKNTEGSILTEILKVNKKVVIKKTDSSITLNKEFIINQSTQENLIKNANQVSIISFLLSAVPLKEDHYLIQLRDFVNSMLWFRNLEDRGYIGLQTGRTNLEEYIISKGLLDDFTSFLEKVSEQHFDFVVPQKEDKHLMCKFGNSIVPFWEIRSTGTNSLILLYYWITNMSTASFVFVDEFDAFYHYKLAYAVSKRLFEMKNCQFFLTSHNTYLMNNDLLRPDCNFILSDNKIKPLCDCTEKDLRFGHNMEKIYKAGALHV